MDSVDYVAAGSVLYIQSDQRCRCLTFQMRYPPEPRYERAPCFEPEDSYYLLPWVSIVSYVILRQIKPQPLQVSAITTVPASITTGEEVPMPASYRPSGGLYLLAADVSRVGPKGFNLKRLRLWEAIKLNALILRISGA